MRRAVALPLPRSRSSARRLRTPPAPSRWTRPTRCTRSSWAPTGRSTTRLRAVCCARLGGSGLAQEPVAAARDATGELVVAAARARTARCSSCRAASGPRAYRSRPAPPARPTCSRTQDGRLELFFRGVDGKLWSAGQTATGWSEPESARRGRWRASRPRSVDGDATPCTVVARETDGQLQHCGSTTAPGRPRWPAATSGRPRRRAASPTGGLEVFAPRPGRRAWSGPPSRRGPCSRSRRGGSQSALAIVGTPAARHRRQRLRCTRVRARHRRRAAGRPTRSRRTGRGASGSRSAARSPATRSRSATAPG